MHMDDVKAYQRENDLLMQNEGTHPANQGSSQDRMPVYSDDEKDYPIPRTRHQHQKIVDFT